MGGCQNYGPFLGTLNIRGRIIIGTHKGAIILTTTHMVSLQIGGAFLGVPRIMIIAFWVNIGVPLFWETTISCQRRGEKDASAFTSAGAHQICSLFLAADSGVCAAIPCNCSKNQNVVDPCFVRASGTGLAFAQSWLGDHHNTKNRRHKDNTETFI